MIQLFKITVVRRPGDWVCDVPPNDLCYYLRDSLFDSIIREVEDVWTICFVLSVAICIDLWFDGAVFDTISFGGYSQRCEHVSFLHVDR